MKFVDRYNWLVQCSRAKYLSLNKIFCVLAVRKQKAKKWKQKKQARNVKCYWDLRYIKGFIILALDIKIRKLAIEFNQNLSMFVEYHKKYIP